MSFTAMCRTVQRREQTEFFVRIFSCEVWDRVVLLVNSSVSDVHVASFFRTDYDILEDGDRNTQSQKNFKSREFCLRVVKFLSSERVYVSCSCMCHVAVT